MLLDREHMFGGPLGILMTAFFTRTAMIAALTCFAAPAAADNLWNHNGSIVSLQHDGENRRFVYVTPRPGLPVTPGTLLFEGKRNGSRYAGTAYVFSSKCGPQAYNVEGIVAYDDRTVAMHGQAPRLDESCHTASYRDDVLIFTLDEPNAEPPPASPTPPPHPKNETLLPEN
jgi:hypothetical protein